MSERSSWATEADYRWADEDDGDDLPFTSLGGCIAIVEGIAPAEALTRLVDGPPSGILRAPAARRWADEQGATTIEAATLGGWTVLCEAYGGQAVQCIEALSAGTLVAVVATMVNADTSFQWACGGVSVRWFDPLLYDEPAGAGSGAPLPEETGLRFGLDAPLASAMACADRLTGVRIAREWIAQREDWVALVNLG